LAKVLSSGGQVQLCFLFTETIYSIGCRRSQDKKQSMKSMKNLTPQGVMAHREWINKK
jgi:hypothetical protein